MNKTQQITPLFTQEHQPLIKTEIHKYYKDHMIHTLIFEYLDRIHEYFVARKKRRKEQMEDMIRERTYRFLMQNNLTQYLTSEQLIELTKEPYWMRERDDKLNKKTDQAIQRATDQRRYDPRFNKRLERIINSDE